MEQSIGLLSLLPPLLVVALAIKSKNVLISLFTGTLTGLVLLCVYRAQSVTEGLLAVLPGCVDMMTGVIADRDNIHLLMFIALLGGLIAVLTAAGCAGAFSDFGVKRIKNRVQAQLATLLLGCIIFIDDYFNAITVGNVMVPITDKFKISRAKLAYIIDSTSAPVTILMPVSSWVATVISMTMPAMLANGFNEGGMSVFLHACVYNYYAWFAVILVALVAVKKFDIGPMAKFEQEYMDTGRDKTVFVDINESVVEEMGDGRKGTAGDLVLLMSLLVVLSIVFMIGNGGGFSGGCSVIEAFMNSDTMLALVYGALCTLFASFVIFVLPGKLSVKQFDAAFLQGVKSMVSAMCILIISWTFSNVLGEDGIGTGEFVAASVNGWLPAWLMPAALFVVSAVISFTTGASWGAMAIMLPTSVSVCAAIDPGMIYNVLGATLAGTVFGDHCSPVSDTTVLSSAGAGCKHLDHVMSQMPYAAVAAAASICGFLVSGISSNAAGGFITGLLVMLLLVYRRDCYRKRAEHLFRD